EKTTPGDFAGVARVCNRQSMLSRFSTFVNDQLRRHGPQAASQIARSIQTPENRHFFAGRQAQAGEAQPSPLPAACCLLLIPSPSATAGQSPAALHALDATTLHSSLFTCSPTHCRNAASPCSW